MPGGAPRTVHEPYAPLGVPKPVAENIWIVDGPEIRMDYFGLRIPFPTRMTVVRLPEGGLWLHSPIQPDEDVIAAIEALGPVRWLIAPNTIHYWWLPDWHARFPDAEVYAVPGTGHSPTGSGTRRALPPYHDLTDTPPEAWADTLDQVMVPGGLLTEADFFHRPSRTLILTDLIENFEPARIRSRFWRWTMRLFGAADPDGKAPYDMQLSFRRNRADVRRAVERMIAWNPERIVIAHGRCYDRDGTKELKRAFRWVL